MEGAFDRKSLSFLDKNLRELVDQAYDYCNHKCTMTQKGIEACKMGCYSGIWVPYKFINHVAKESEGKKYKECLAKKYPNISDSDYAECT